MISFFKGFIELFYLNLNNLLLGSVCLIAGSVQRYSASLMLPFAVKTNDEAWLIDREMDASKKIFVTARIIVLDFELFIGGRCEWKLIL